MTPPAKKYRVRISCTRGAWVYLVGMDTSNVRWVNDGSGTKVQGKINYTFTSLRRPCDPAGATVFSPERAAYLMEILNCYRRIASLEEVTA